MSRNKPDRRPRDGGFTLIELLVVVVIVMVLAGLLLTAAFAFLARMRRERARVDIRNLTMALSAFHKDHRCYPPDRQALEEIRIGRKSKDMFFFPTSIVGEPDDYFENIMREDDDIGPVSKHMGKCEGRASNELLVYYLARELPKGENSFGPYMQFRRKQLKNTETVGKDEYPEFVDPWGMPYVYIENHSDNVGKPPNERRRHGSFELYSRGPDGILDHNYWDEQTERLDPEDDDIASWSE